MTTRNVIRFGLATDFADIIVNLPNVLLGGFKAMHAQHVEQLLCFIDFNKFIRKASVTAW